MPNPPICIWFKRDLRIEDHAPLAQAALQGPLLPLYIIEPDIIHAPDFDALHWQFIQEALHELNQQLTRLGQPLIIRTGEATDVELTVQVPEGQAVALDVEVGVVRHRQAGLGPVQRVDVGDEVAARVGPAVPGVR